MASSADSGFVVVTKVFPQSQTAAQASCTTQHVSSALQKFLKGEPKALGTVQIMIGVMEILCGIILSIHAESIGVFSGIFFWGALIFISSGALSVAANNKLNKCLVRAALGMNIISTVTAGISIILFSLNYILERHYGCYDSSRSCGRYKEMVQTMSFGINGVMLLFSILEFIISISVSAFACKAVCVSSSEQVVYIAPASSQVTSGNLVSTSYAHEMPILGQNMMDSMQSEKPPEYDALS